MEIVGHNLKEGGEGEAEVKNAVASAILLRGERLGRILWRTALEPPGKNTECKS